MSTGVPSAWARWSGPVSPPITSRARRSRAARSGEVGRRHVRGGAAAAAVDRRRQPFLARGDRRPQVGRPVALAQPAGHLAPALAADSACWPSRRPGWSRTKRLAAAAGAVSQARRGRASRAPKSAGSVEACRGHRAARARGPPRVSPGATGSLIQNALDGSRRQRAAGADPRGPPRVRAASTPALWLPIRSRATSARSVAGPSRKAASSRTRLAGRRLGARRAAATTSSSSRSGCAGEHAGPSPSSTTQPMRASGNARRRAVSTGRQCDHVAEGAGAEDEDARRWWQRSGLTPRTHSPGASRRRPVRSRHALEIEVRSLVAWSLGSPTRAVRPP